jgi:tetratricopeptide (TPR) repeat protein
MRIVFSITCILLSTLSFAQKSKLTGFVTEQNTGMRIAGAMVKSFGANPIESSNSGYFILAFQDLPAGKNIIVRAEKDGWELVNEKEMNTLIPEKPDEKPFKIIFCKAGLLAKAKSRYYETFELNLQKELDNQKALNKGNVKKIASLEEDYARVQKQLYDLADEYSRIDLSSASAKDLQAIDLFKAGKYDEFISLKNSIVTEVQVDKAIQNKNEAVKKIANADSTVALYFKSQKDIAKTLVLQFKFNEAEKLYERIVSKDTSDIDNTYDFAYFLAKQNQQDKAILYYQRALKLSQHEYYSARILNNLGNLYRAKNDYTTALNAYQKALIIRQRLTKLDSSFLEYDVAETQNNLGILYQDKNDYLAALAAYQKANEIFERLAERSPAKYESSLAVTQNNLGTLFQYKNDFSAALNAYQRALEIRERLAQSDLAAYEPGVAETLHNLGTLFQNKSNYSSALNAYQKALEITERLVKVNPAAYEPYLGTILNNLGILYRNKKDYTAALNAYQKALEIRERLAKANPDTYESNLAMTLNNLGILYKDKNDYAAALNAYQKALEIWERLVKINQDIYEPDLAMTLINLGILYKDRDEYSSALNAYQRALEIRERLAKINPATYEPDLATTLNNLGILYRDKNDYASALNAYQKALEINERLVKADQVTYEPDLAMTLNNLGTLFQYNNDYPAALKAYQQATEIRERLAKANPVIYEPDLATTLDNMGLFYQSSKNYESSFTAYQKALEIYKRLAKINPEVYEIKYCGNIVLLGLLQEVDYQETRQSLIATYLEIAKQILPKYPKLPLSKKLLDQIEDEKEYFDKIKILAPIKILQQQIEKTEDYSEKIEIQKKIIDEYRLLIENGRSTFVIDFGNNLSSLAWYQIFARQFYAAELSAKEALNPTKYIKTEGYDEKIEWANTNMAMALLFQGKYQDAEQIYRRLKDKPHIDGTYTQSFLADLDELEKAGITHPDVAKIRALLKKNK